MFFIYNLKIAKISKQHILQQIIWYINTNVFKIDDIISYVSKLENITCSAL